MNLNKELKMLLYLSFGLSILGFILDLGERVPDLLVNLRDIGVMTFVIFLLISAVYFPAKFLVRRVSKSA